MVGSTERKEVGGSVELWVDLSVDGTVDSKVGGLVALRAGKREFSLAARKAEWLDFVSERVSVLARE